MLNHYILNEDNTIKAVDLLTWSKWFERSTNRFLRSESLIDRSGWMSAVFIGINMDYFDAGPPLVFEVMSLATDPDAPDKNNIGEEMIRTATYDEAIAAYEDMARRYGLREKPKRRGVQPVATGPRKVRL